MTTSKELMEAACAFAMLAESPFQRQIRESMEHRVAPELRPIVRESMLFSRTKSKER